MDVPAGQAGSPVVEKHSAPAINNSHINSSTTNRKSIPENDILHDPQPAANHDEGGSHTAAMSPGVGVKGGFAENRESLTRKSRYPARKNAAARGSIAGEDGVRPMGVQLVDKPMDD